MPAKNYGGFDVLTVSWLLHFMKQRNRLYQPGTKQRKTKTADRRGWGRETVRPPAGIRSTPAGRGPGSTAWVPFLRSGLFRNLTVRRYWGTVKL